MFATQTYEVESCAKRWFPIQILIWKSTIQFVRNKFDYGTVGQSDAVFFKCGILQQPVRGWLERADWKKLTGASLPNQLFSGGSSPEVRSQSLSKFSKHQNEMRRISPIFREFCKVLNLKLATPKQPALLGTICNRPEVCVHLLRRNKEIDEKWGTHVCEYSNFNSFDFWGPSVLPIEADSLE